MNEQRLNNALLNAGMYRHLDTVIFRKCLGGKVYHNPPVMKEMRFDNGVRIMYKSDRECWHNAGKRSKEQNLPRQFGGYGIAPNWHVYFQYMKPGQMDLIYWSDLECDKDEFYYITAEDLETWEGNKGKTDDGEDVLIIDYKAFKRIDMNEVRRRHGY